MSAFVVTATLRAPVGGYGDRILLDSLLAYAVMASRGDRPRALPRGAKPSPWAPEDLPLQPVMAGDAWWWDCSAAMGDIVGVDVRNHRAKFDARKAHMHTTARRANTAAGLLKGIDLPLPTMLIERMTWTASGDLGETLALLRRYVHGIGKRRNTGLGMIDRWEGEEVTETQRRELEAQHFGDGPIRHVPAKDDGERRMLRLHPPYWSPVDRVLCVVPPPWEMSR
jgi:CRISPR type IV-associated protein Csf3